MKSRYLVASCALLGVTGLHASDAPSDAPTLAQIRNGVVRNVVQGQNVQLKNGIYEGPPFKRGGSERPRVELIERFSATGNLDDVLPEERVVILRHVAGPSGVKVYLAVYGMRGERVANISTVLLGDRAQPNVLSIAGGLVIVELVEAGHQSRKVFRLGAHGLEPVPAGG